MWHCVHVHTATQEGEEFLAREAKRAKTDEEEAAQEEKDPEVAAEAWGGHDDPPTSALAPNTT